MAVDRKRQLLLGILGLALAFFLYRALASPSGVRPLSSNGSVTGTAAANRQPVSAAATAPDVHLEKLEAERPRPGDTERDLFRFKPKPPPRPSAPVVPVRADPSPAAPIGPPAQPPLPPIALKFIGLIGPGAEVPKIAVLTDGKGLPVYGKEGDIILGQFRLIRIGAESVDLSYLDGRGRQTVRLSGG